MMAGPCEPLGWVEPPRPVRSGRPDDRLRETHHLLLCHTRAVTNYRRNFIRGGSFFFAANLAERRLRLIVDDIVSAKDDGFRCRSTHPTGCKSLSSVDSVGAAITFNSRHLSTCGP
jgi:hypothetical protein